MKKIPTIFERDWDNDPSRVLEQPAEGCEWVFAGEGVATRKYDGTSCMVRDGILYKRLSIPEGKPEPPGIFVATETVPGKPSKTILWVEVGDGPEDKWHREAWAAFEETPPDGTYELLGPKVQGNPEGFSEHLLMPHADAETLGGIVLTFSGLREVLAIHNIEGIVFHHPDGRMAKIKARDYGIKRGAAVAV
jgi:hypothetical protein